MDVLKTTGKRMVFWGAILLIGLAVFEFSIRIEDFYEMLLRPSFLMIRDGLTEALGKYLNRVRWSRLIAHLFLLVSILFGAYSLIFRKKLASHILGAIFAALLLSYSLTQVPLVFTFVWHYIKLLTLILILVGNGILIAHFFLQMYRGDRHKPESIQPLPYQPFEYKQKDE